MSAAEMRAMLARKKKADPRKETVDLKTKYQIIQNMWVYKVLPRGLVTADSLRRRTATSVFFTLNLSILWFMKNVNVVETSK